MSTDAKIPKMLRWTGITGGIFLAVMTLLRIAFFYYSRPAGTGFFASFRAFALGFRFDLRSASILMVLMLLLGAWRFSDPFLHRAARRAFAVLLALVSLGFVLFYIVDFAWWAYLSQRLNASVLNYLEDAGISLGMVWQTYPVIPLTLVLLGGTALLTWLVMRSFRRISERHEPARTRGAAAWFLGFFLLCAFFIFGAFTQYGLRWSDAFSLGGDYRANLALNPFQSFASGMKFRKSTYSEAKTRSAYNLLKPWFGFRGDSASLDYARPVTDARLRFPVQPNIVVVICESFSAYKSSMWGNPLNTTPFFDSLCRNGIFFDHCFTPSYGTARGVWAVLTGIPDVGQANSTTSRNPAAVDQHSILNDFAGYEKLYFLGGSASWANIRGLLENNVAGLRLYEQENFSAPKADVWGVSDKNLFLEANKVLSAERKPFVAVIQTADNHRPYTIPEEDRAAFSVRTVTADSLRRFGFESNEEMNAFRYTDFSYRTFFEAAREAPYFRNTIFLFVGDHGIAGNAGSMFPRPWTDQRLTNMHVPLLIYAPALLAPRRDTRWCSQLDLLPTAAGLAAIKYTNTTLGHDLLDSAQRPPAPFAFTYDPDKNFVGLLLGGFFYRKQLETGREEMNNVANDAAPDAAAVRDSVTILRQLTGAIYETSRYLLLHNKKRP